MIYGELEDQTNNMSYPRPLLYCYVCDSEYSAHRGDYFMHNPNEKILCCGEPMSLVTKQVTYRRIK
jgi:hypothetical protein